MATKSRESSVKDFSRGAGMKMQLAVAVNMANLCIVASNSVNGVAKLHTEILKQQELNHFYKIFPEKFNNKTNGITHRRWLMSCNPDLKNLLDKNIGKEWHKEPILLEKLTDFEDNKAFLDELDKVKHKNKVKLAEYIQDRHGIKVDTHSIFDMQSKRLHEYKRQLMNALHIIHSASAEIGDMCPLLDFCVDGACL